MTLFFLRNEVIILVFLIPHPKCQGWSIRPAAPSHVPIARQILLSEWMNPLSVSQEHLWVAVSDNKDENSEGDESLLGFGQMRPLSAGCKELASLYVVPSERRKGIATQLISTLLKQQEENEENHSTICLLTLRPTVPLYEPHGFRVVDPNAIDLPVTLQVEFLLGTMISKLLGNELVCMVRTTKT
jgi:GNAT superfamily N-acetyltransferase